MSQRNPEVVPSLAETNVLFVTLDCCRHDTYEKADLPYLKSLGEAESAQTHGTYTLPAHASFYMGYLATAQQSTRPYYNSGVKQLWRMANGRPRSEDTVGIILPGETIIDGYRQLGHYALGTGGVRWFRNSLLRRPFDEFIFHGPEEELSVFNPRKPNDFSLNHIDELAEKVSTKDKFFLFVNSLETHVPYDTGDEPIPDWASDIMEKASSLWGCKTGALEQNIVTQAELESLQQLQVSALEAVDTKLKNLIERLAKPLLLVVSGDHGECFGEDMLWGHGYPHPKVMEVPLLITTIKE